MFKWCAQVWTLREEISGSTPSTESVAFKVSCQMQSKSLKRSEIEYLRAIKLPELVTVSQYRDS